MWKFGGQKKNFRIVTVVINGAFTVSWKSAGRGIVHDLGWPKYFNPWPWASRIYQGFFKAISKGIKVELVLFFRILQ